MFIVFMAHITLDRPFEIRLSGQFDEMPRAISLLRQHRKDITEYHRAHNEHVITDEIEEGQSLISTPEITYRLMVGGISTEDFPNINSGSPIYFCVTFEYPHKQGSPEPRPGFWARIKSTYLNACGLAAVKAYEVANSTGDRSDIDINTRHDAEAMPEWTVRKGNQRVLISAQTLRWSVATIAEDEDQDVQRIEASELPVEELEAFARVG
ncbi:hypothetical protein BKA63DRAFT_167735 [Paraphoma chrysanthemicola]|nr:hypothetical protein BKA63DRAFT_167735 [Paraphoma chrysanthemicola]